jgi:hypothetical protein
MRAGEQCQWSLMKVEDSFLSQGVHELGKHTIAVSIIFIDSFTYRVHEYGGSCTAVLDGVFYFSDISTSQIARISSNGDSEYVTPGMQSSLVLEHHTNILG